VILPLALSVLLFPATEAAMSVDDDTAARLARLALDCVHREYPNKIAHVLAGDDDVRPPRELTPAFHGCFDWHSAVHGHWLLARLAHRFPDAPFAEEAFAALDHNLTPETIAAEVAYVTADGRASFERPYGLAWLLELARELRAHPTSASRAATLAPLEAVAADRFREWLPKLLYPIRTGEHSQTAFALGLVLDWARATGDTRLEALVVDRTREFHLGDTACNLAYEPSGQDFLSPCLAEADLLRRVLPPAEFATWLTGFLPVIPETADDGWIPVARVSDRSDGKLAHLDGLNLSRAWMLDGIRAGLPAEDPRRAALAVARDTHARAGLDAVTGEHYEGGHWLGSFAVYLLTRAGR